MSQKVQVKETPVFQDCAKMVCFPAWHGSGVSGSVCFSLLVSVNTWCSLYNMRGYLGISGSVFRDISICFGDQMCSGAYLRAPSMQYWVRLDLLGHHNIETSLKSLKKIIWVDHFFLLFSCIREKLKVTVSLDHPVFIYFYVFIETLW